MELAETAAVGRALSDAGFGLQFADKEEDFDPEVTEAPIEQYVLNTLDNCMHAPRNACEFTKDIRVLNKTETYETIDEPMNIYKLNRYSQLTLKDLTESSHKICNMLNANENIENKYSDSGRYCLYLYDDEEHLPGDVAGILYEALDKPGRC